MLDPLTTLWKVASTRLRLALALDLVVEILKAVDGHRIKITLDDGNYEVKLNKLEEEHKK